VFLIVTLLLGSYAAEAEAEAQLEVTHEVELRQVSRSQEQENEWNKFMNGHQEELLLEVEAEHSQRVAVKEKVKHYTMYLEDIRNSEFVGTIAVGTPPQKMDVILDTGSSQLWINSEKCKSESCLIHKRFDSSKSSTFKQLPVGMSVRFGSGKIYGTLGQDTIAIGPIQVTGQTTGMIERAIGGVFMSGPFDGIMGLSFPKLSASKYPLFMDTVIAQEVLHENKFSFFYTDTPGLKSSCAFGAPQQEAVHGSHLLGARVARHVLGGENARTPSRGKEFGPVRLQHALSRRPRHGHRLLHGSSQGHRRHHQVAAQAQGRLLQHQRLSHRHL